MNAKIHEAVGRANARGACDASCLVRELQKSVGANVRNPLTGIGHARLAGMVENAPGIDRCHLKFKESIYGARPYNQPWLFVFNGRIMFLSDSIRLAGRVVGTDKINHFIREVLRTGAPFMRMASGIESVMAHELGAPGWQLRLNEERTQGHDADRSAVVRGSGRELFRIPILVGPPDARHAGLVHHTLMRPPAGLLSGGRFPSSRHVNDAWDETINRSAFHPVLAKQVATALRDRSMDAPNARLPASDRIAVFTPIPEPLVFRGRCRTALNLSICRLGTKTIDDVIVHQADSLHEGIADSRSDELEASFRQVAAQLARLGRQRRYALTCAPAVHTRLSADKLPHIGIETAEFTLNAQKGFRVGHRAGDF